MSLDIAILDDDRKPLRTVPIGLLTHERLMGAAESNSDGLLFRLKDYYSDAEFGRGEIPKLRHELLAIWAQVDESETRSRIDEVVELLDEAIRLNRAVVVLAD
jgi:hypothetical protein